MTLDELMNLTDNKWIAYYTANPTINQKRQDIATYMPEWGIDWYSNPTGLQQLYYFLDDLALLYTRDQNRRDLFDELDFDEMQDAAGEFEPLTEGEEEEEIPDSARLTWFTTLADEVSLPLRYSDPEWSDAYGLWYRYDRETGLYAWNEDPQNTPRAWIGQEEADELVVSRASRPGQADAAPDRYDAPAWSDAYGMYYRYDWQAGQYEWNREPWLTPAAWMSQKQADVLISSQTPQPGAARDGEAGYSSAAWDENWQMFYRLRSDGVYQYADSSDGAGTGQPGPWLSYDDVLERRAGARAATEAGAQSPTAGTDSADTGAGAETATASGSTGQVARSLAEAQAAVADAGLEVLRRAAEEAPEIARLLARLTPEERHRVLGQAMADGAEALPETPAAA
ncbi:MAG TPA: hypothetical protein VHY58_12170 [Streptosporangiaceae bacterium]|nr:hypothetical protein [Streptosporangiaceae bacterium]